jgi:hypothetical protein
LFADYGWCAQDNSGANVVDLLNHVAKITLKISEEPQGVWLERV